MKLLTINISSIEYRVYVIPATASKVRPPANAVNANAEPAPIGTDTGLAIASVIGSDTMKAHAACMKQIT
jgi:hypothetical protein